MNSENYVYFKNVIYPQNATDSANGDTQWPSTYIDASDFSHFSIFVSIGNNNIVGGGVSFKVVQATDENGTDSKEIPNTDISIINGGEEDRNVLLSVDCQKLDSNNNFRFVALEMTKTGTNYVRLSSVFLGFGSEDLPISQDDFIETSYSGI